MIVSPLEFKEFIRLLQLEDPTTNQRQELKYLTNEMSKMQDFFCEVLEEKENYQLIIGRSNKKQLLTKMLETFETELKNL